jgi:tetratricopeptide (TPR) repeat protein
MRAGDLVANRFLVERFVESGGMGSVHRALDRSTGKPVALKSLLVHDAAGIERFEREATLLETLRHPGVVAYVAHGRSGDGIPYLAMEWLDGEDLATRFQRSGLTAAEALALGAQVADALAAAHARGVVHRDVKPANVFLVDGAAERVKVLDFGIARLENATRVLTGSGMVMGTLGYMAPEQARGGVELDGRVDVFALGCVLFECLAGRPAYAGERGLAVLASILLEEPPVLSDVMPHVPAELDALIARAMAKERDARPSMVELAAALRGAPQLEMRAPVRRATAEPAITGIEQRFASVILVGPEPRASAATAATVPAHQASSAPPAAMALIARHGGRMEQLADGSLAACFIALGMPTDQAAQAARCALALQAELPARPVVLATGRSVVSNRVPLGEVLDRGARMLTERDRATGSSEPPRAHEQAAAHSRAVRVDSVTLALLGDRFDVRHDPLGALLVGERMDDAGVRTLLGRATPCVGRERELRMLEAIAESCFDGGGAAAVLVSAPPGVGKSRTARELSARLRARWPKLKTWKAEADLLSHGSPLAMLAALVRRAAGATEGEPADARRAKLEARAAEHLPREEAHWTAAFLGELIHAPADLSSLPASLRMQLEAARADPQQTSRDAQRAFLRLLEADCTAGPVLLLLEDLHWCDRATVERIDAALDQLQDRPLMVLALARPEVTTVHPGLWEERGVQEIRLRELAPRAAGELVRAVLGSELDDGTVATLVDRAAGNAFFLEELIRSAAELGTRAADMQQLPETVLAMLEARLVALGDRARRVLRAGSVFGDVFWTGGARALLGGAEAESLDETLEELVRREVVSRKSGSRYAGDDELAFRHALVREAAYGTLTEADRRLGHKLAAAWLSARGETDPQLLAEHLERGAHDAADRLQAAGTWARAGQRAADRCAHADAISHYDRALTLLGAEPAPAGLPIELAVRLGRGSSNAGLRGYAVPEVEEDFQRALNLAQALGEAPPLFRALIGLYSFSALRSRFATAQQIGERCLRIAQATGDPFLEFEAYRPLYSVAIFVGETSAAVRYIELASGLLEKAAKRPQPVMVSLYTEVTLWLFEALTLWLRGELDRAIETIARAIRFAEERRHSFSIGFALFGEILLRRVRSEPELALAAAERLCALAEQHDFPWLRGVALCYRGWAEAQLGNPDVGIPRMRNGLEGLLATGATMTMPDVHCALAECCIEQGRFDEARRALDAGAQLAAESGGVLVEPERLRLQALLELAQHGDAALPGALALANQSIAMARKHEAVALEIRAARVLAAVLVRQGHLDQARAALDGSLARCQGRGSMPDLASARSERAALG